MISVITPVHNRIDLTKNYLKSLLVEKEYLKEIIIINNSSTDDTVSYLENLKNELNQDSDNPKLIIINNTENKPFSVACNQGAKIAKSEFLLFLNNDMIILPEFIQNLLNTFKIKDSCGIAGAKLLYKDLTIQHCGVIFNDGYTVEHQFKGFDYSFPYSTEIKEYQAVTGATIMIKNELFKSINGFTEGYFNCYEDLDLCFKVKEQDFKIYCNQSAIAIHLESKTEGRKNPKTEKISGQFFLDNWHKKIVFDGKKKLEEAFCDYLQFKNSETGIIDLNLISKSIHDSYLKENHHEVIFYSKLLFRIDPLHFSRKNYQIVVNSCFEIGLDNMAEFFIKRKQEFAIGLKEFDYNLCSINHARKNNLFNINTKQIKYEKGLISIIIPVFNNLSYTRKCLESIFKYSDVNYEIIIVNNNSNDGTKEYLDKLQNDYSDLSNYCKNFKVIHNQENKSFSISNNQGSKVSNGEFLLLLNNDTLVTKKWLSSFLFSISENNEIGMIGAKLLYPDRTIQHAGVIYNKENALPFHFMQGSDCNHPAVNQKREFNSVTAASLLIRSEVFNFCNGFNESYINCWEDADLCLRVRLLGYKIIYDPKIEIYHYESKTPGRKDNVGYGANIFRTNWGSVYKNYATAENDYKKFNLKLTYNPNNHSLLFDFFDIKILDRLKQAKVYFDNKNLPDYLNLIEPVRLLVPTKIEPETYLQIFEAYFILGNIEKSLDVLKRAAEIYPENQEVVSFYVNNRASLENN